MNSMPDHKAKSKRNYQVPAVERALDILEFLNRIGQASFTEIYTRLGLPKSSVYQILYSLEERGYVRRAGGSANYVLGLKLFEMGNKAVSLVDIRSEAMPVLRELVDQTNETCHLGVLDGLEGVYLAKMEGTRPVRLNSWEGKRMPLHCTAMGKALLAWQNPAQLAHLLDQIELKKSTEYTITQRQNLMENLELVRQRGWALDDQENESHIRCVAAPIHGIDGEVRAAISVSGLANQFDGEYLFKLADKVVSACRRLSSRLGA
jgi:DNA-binding IclR family transcriptional regulator